MLSRRHFLVGGLAGLVAGCEAIQQQAPAESESLDLKGILEQGILHLRNQKYTDARTFFRERRTSVPSEDTKNYKTNAHLDFLYAISLVAGTRKPSFSWLSAGEILTGLFYRIKDSPWLLESLQEFVNPVFALEEYAAKKTMFKEHERLQGRYRMFHFLLCMVEEDYTEAQTSLKEAYRVLDTKEQHDVDHTFSLLRDAAERAAQRAKKQDTTKYEHRIEAYKVLTKSVQ